MNVANPEAFRLNLEALIDAMYGAFRQTRETPSNVAGADNESDDTCFQVSSEYERPREFFQCMLDMIRIVFEPSPPGTMLLNANPCFIFDAIRQSQFRLGYLSEISEPEERIGDFYDRMIKPKMDACGYLPGAASAMFVFATLGKGQQKMAKVAEISTQFMAGLSINDALQSLADTINGEAFEKPGGRYAGFSVDEAMGSRMRISIWLFIPPATCH